MSRSVPALLAVLLLAGCGGGDRSRADEPPRTVVVPPPPVARTECDRFAAPGGSDAATGRAGAPLRTPQALADALQPGDTGCLRGGTYRAQSNTGYVLRLVRGGRPGQPITLRSVRGERARLAGVVYVAHGADHVTLADLDVDDPTSFARTGQITIQVDATDTRLVGLDVTNRAHKTCVILGSLDGYGAAVRTVIERSRLHECGDPANNLFDHAVYVSNARDARIAGNLIEHASGYAVQLFPAASRTVVAGNVMVENGGGVIFAGEGTHASSDNRVTGNVIAGSGRDYNLATFWPALVGRGNLASGNCLIAGAGGDVELGPGLTARDNVTPEPVAAGSGLAAYRSACGGVAAKGFRAPLPARG